jgi:hypothetical protein
VSHFGSDAKGVLVVVLAATVDVVAGDVTGAVVEAVAPSPVAALLVGVVAMVVGAAALPVVGVVGALVDLLPASVMLPPPPPQALVTSTRPVTTRPVRRDLGRRRGSCRRARREESIRLFIL